MHRVRFGVIEGERLLGCCFLFQLNSILFANHIILRLHYVPGGHGGHVSDHREQNGITVRQRMGAGYANVARRDNREHGDKFFDSLEICHGSHGGSEKRNGP